MPSAQSSDLPQPLWKRLLPRVQRAFLLVALIAIAAYLSQHLEKLQSLQDPRLLRQFFLVVLVQCIAHCIVSAAYCLCAGQLQIGLGARRGLSIYFRRLLFRYVPGGIWHAVARYTDLKATAGTGMRSIGQLFLLESTVTAAAGAAISGLALILVPAITIDTRIAALHFAAAIALFLLPFVPATLAQATGRLMATTLMGLAWSCNVIGFSLIAHAVFALQGQAGCTIGEVSGAYVVSAVYGYLAVFAPQGWGVTEASYSLLDPCGTALYSVLFAFVLYRLCSATADLTCFVLWWMASKRRARRGNTAEGDED